MRRLTVSVVAFLLVLTLLAGGCTPENDRIQTQIIESLHADIQGQGFIIAELQQQIEDLHRELAERDAMIATLRERLEGNE